MLQLAYLRFDVAGISCPITIENINIKTTVISFVNTRLFSRPYDATPSTIQVLIGPLQSENINIKTILLFIHLLSIIYRLLSTSLRNAIDVPGFNYPIATEDIRAIRPFRDSRRRLHLCRLVRMFIIVYFVLH